jgi:hypothetical protein
MNISPEISFPFTSKNFIRFLTLFFLCILLLISKMCISDTAQAAISFVGLTVHSYDQGDYNGKITYVTLTYTDGNGNTHAHVFCQQMSPQNWYRIPVDSFVKAGTSIWIRYFSNSQCYPSSEFLEASPQIPATPSVNHCWFNPNPTVNDLNWSGCVNPSQHVDITFASDLDVAVV